MRAAIDSFLDSLDVRANPNTLRAYTSVPDRVGEEIDTRRRLAEVLDDEIAGALTGHKSLRSVQRYVKPGLAAVHAATETLSSPRRRG